MAENYVALGSDLERALDLAVMLKDERDALHNALGEALGALYNPFEPDNQSATYKRLKAVHEQHCTDKAGEQ